MSRPFPTDHPMLRGPWEPWPMEGEIRDCAVVGELPRELHGTLYRNGPNPQFAPTGGYHFFLGDGMVHAFHFEDGRCSYRNRFVRTPRFEAERAAGRPLFGDLFAGEALDPAAKGVPNGPANTNIVWHGGRLLALVEGGLEPVELDPETLATRGVWDFAGRLRRPIDPELAALLGIETPDGKAPGPFTAHPKLDPETGEMLAFGYSLFPPYHVFHPMNAYDDGPRVIVDVAQYPRLPLPLPGEERDFVALATWVRWTLDLDAGTLKQEARDDRSIEFPRIDERRVGLPYRYGYAGAGSRSAVHGFDQLVRYDVQTGSAQVHALGSRDAANEPVFVPRSADAPEGDGWLLAVVWRGEENRSDLLVLDARHVDREPLAIVQLPHRVPNGFHGNFRNLSA